MSEETSAELPVAIRSAFFRWTPTADGGRRPQVTWDDGVAALERYRAAAARDARLNPEEARVATRVQQLLAWRAPPVMFAFRLALARNRQVTIEMPVDLTAEEAARVGAAVAVQVIPTSAGEPPVTPRAAT